MRQDSVNTKPYGVALQVLTVETPIVCDMAIKDFQHYFVPTLQVLARDGRLHRTELLARVAKEAGLTAEEIALTNSRGTSIYGSRIHWAGAFLVQAGAIVRPERGYMEITDRGRKLLQENPNGFKRDVLMQFREYQEFIERRGTRSRGNDESPDDVLSAGSPQEQIEQAIDDLESTVSAELVSRVHQMPPIFLERTVLKLLRAMGYGDDDDSLQHVGGPGDEGVDGVINQDLLGLQRIYVQAKRYAADKSVGRPSVQSFVGALAGQGANSGIFITTSTFSQDAKDYVQRHMAARIVLIDGVQLGQLMVRHGIGVQSRRSYQVMEIDEDFFAD